MGEAITHGDRLIYRGALLQVEVDVINASIDIHCICFHRNKDGGYGHGLQLISCCSLVYYDQLMAELRREGIEAFENFTRMPPEMYDEIGLLAKVAPQPPPPPKKNIWWRASTELKFQEPGVWSKMRSGYLRTDSMYYLLLTEHKSATVRLITTTCIVLHNLMLIRYPRLQNRPLDTNDVDKSIIPEELREGRNMRDTIDVHVPSRYQSWGKVAKSSHQQVLYRGRTQRSRLCN